MIVTDRIGRVAIFYGHMIPMGGAEKVTLTTINAVSDLGLDVDLYVLSPFDAAQLASSFGSHIKASYRIHITKTPRFPSLRFHHGGAYLSLVKGFIEKRVEKCDLFIDMAPDTNLGANYLRIPDFVYWNVLPVGLPYIFNQRYGIAGEVQLGPFRHLLSRLLKRWELVKVHVANSLFTQRAIINRLAGDLKPIVIYPPVDIRRWATRPGDSLDRDGVASLGRFEMWKRHDLQLKIMRGLRSRLRMIGRAVTDQETVNLQQLKEIARGIENVEFHVNLPHLEVRRFLHSSKVFLHTADSEPFGMAVVEAIAAGCVPVVRDQGAMAEIVPIDELRFETKEEGRHKIERALRGEFDHYLPKLRSHVERFDEAVFRKEMTKRTVKVLGSTPVRYG